MKQFHFCINIKAKDHRSRNLKIAGNRSDSISKVKKGETCHNDDHTPTLQRTELWQSNLLSLLLGIGIIYDLLHVQLWYQEVSHSLPVTQFLTSFCSPVRQSLCLLVMQMMVMVGIFVLVMFIGCGQCLWHECYFQLIGPGVNAVQIGLRTTLCFNLQA